ncbi:hypothetical protein AJ79_08644 [Helicocarpus griseus UAMH5409]|uniref:Uncharacterized protein n=1 Tax=Helicocarpus griseus UAMH5409 TaxID=1447875 RepID=A0A2B7WRE0_9EURO|nr:hypothetical protein AJ79_08644 [Helicocarpus griseus UAMH5409]
MSQAKDSHRPLAARAREVRPCQDCHSPLQMAAGCIRCQPCRSAGCWLGGCPYQHCDGSITGAVDSAIYAQCMALTHSQPLMGFMGFLAALLGASYTGGACRQHQILLLWDQPENDSSLLDNLVRGQEIQLFCNICQNLRLYVHTMTTALDITDGIATVSDELLAQEAVAASTSVETKTISPEKY